MIVEAKIKALESHSSNYGEKLQSEISGVQDQFYHYFDSLKEDVPTGETPQKRSIPHPTSFPRTAAEDEIVADSSFAPRFDLLSASTVKAPSQRMSLPASPTEFADFVGEDARTSESTPLQAGRHTPFTASKVMLDERKQQLEKSLQKHPQEQQQSAQRKASAQQQQEASTKQKTKADKQADLRAAVKAKRAQQDLLKSKGKQGAQRTVLGTATNRQQISHK